MSGIINLLNRSAQANGINLDAIQQIVKADDLKLQEQVICSWLDGFTRTNVHDQEAVETIRKHLSSIFAAKQDVEAKANLDKASNALLNAKKQQLTTEGAVPLNQRIIAGELKASLEQIHGALNSNIQGLNLGEISIEDQRLDLFKLTVGTQGNLKAGETLESKLGEAIQASASRFTAEGLKNLKNELAQEMIYSEGGQIINQRLGSINIALAGPSAVIDGKNHELYSLANRDSIQCQGADLSKLSLEALQKLQEDALGKLAKFWDQPETKQLLTNFGVSFVEGKEPGSRIMDTSSLKTVEAKKAFNIGLSETMINYINNEEASKLEPNEKAIIKEFAKRSAIIQQEGLSFSKIARNLLGAANISSLLSSGVFGLIAGKMGSPMLGLIVTVMSFLLSSGGAKSTEAKPVPPQPAAA